MLHEALSMNDDNRAFYYIRAGRGDEASWLMVHTTPQGLKQRLTAERAAGRWAHVYMMAKPLPNGKALLKHVGTGSLRHVSTHELGE